MRLTFHKYEMNFCTFFWENKILKISTKMSYFVSMQNWEHVLHKRHLTNFFFQKDIFDEFSRL